MLRVKMFYEPSNERFAEKLKAGAAGGMDLELVSLSDDPPVEGYRFEDVDAVLVHHNRSSEQAPQWNRVLEQARDSGKPVAVLQGDASVQPLPNLGLYWKYIPAGNTKPTEMPGQIRVEIEKQIEQKQEDDRRKTKPPTDYGIVGFFDILGYQSFLDNNEPEEAASEVLEQILALSTTIPDTMRETIKGNKKLVEEMVNELRWLIFSDTVLLSIRLPHDDSDRRLAARWVVFIQAALILNRQMFDFGLPLRGVIATGRFLVKGTCFAGRPIIDAYRLANDLDLSGCVMTPRAFQEVADMADKRAQHGQLWATLPAFFVPYLVPRKSGREEKLATLNIQAICLETSEKFGGDLRQLVYETFWKHRKDIPTDVMRKVTNTEQLLRYVRATLPTFDSIRDDPKTPAPKGLLEQLKALRRRDSAT